MNPELRRNLWLEITAHRLLGMPAILALIFLAVAAMAESRTTVAVSMTALGGFVALTLLWGTRLAANSVIDELTDKTWDWQRLSTLHPWTMTWGKLFGSTAFAWYGGILCLLVFMITASEQQFRSPVRLGISLVLTAITLHATAMASALHMAKQGIAAKRRSLGLALVLVLILINISSVMLARTWSVNASARWYGHSFDVMNFLLGSASVFAAWSMAGAYRSMCSNLMVRTTPWLWLLFLVFLTGYTTGFLWDVVPATVPLVAMLAGAGLVWSLLFTYVMMFTELSGPGTFRRITWKMQMHEWRRAFEELPCWPLSWAFAALCAMIVAAYGNNSDLRLWREITATPIALVLICARDVGILLFFLAAPQPKRAVGTALIYIAVLSWILPVMLRAMNMPQLAELLLPIGGDNQMAQIIAALVQAGIALSLAWHRIRQCFTV